MRYHEKIGKICNDFGESLKDKGIINSFKDCPISISHLRDIREDSYKYKPDVYYLRKSDKRYITFQVLFSQGKNPKEIIGDVLNAILTIQIKYGYFIVSNSEDYERVDNILKVSYSILQDIYKLKKREDLPDIQLILIEPKNKVSKIIQTFEKLCKKYKWCN